MVGLRHYPVKTYRTELPNENTLSKLKITYVKSEVWQRDVSRSLSLKQK